MGLISIIGSLSSPSASGMPSPPPPTGDVATITSLYVTASGRSADETILQTFTTALNNAGIYDKMVAGYILNGGSSTACKYNLFDPFDLDDAFRAVFTGSPTFNSDGTLFHGSADKMETYVNWPLVAGVPNVGASWYQRNEVPSGSVVSDANYFVLYPRDNTGKAYPLIGNLSGTGITVPTHTGLVGEQRTNDSTVAVYHNGVSVGTEALAQNTLSASDKTIKLHATYSGGINTNNCTYSFFFIHMTLSDSENTAFNTAVQNMATSFGINL